MYDPATHCKILWLSYVNFMNLFYTFSCSKSTAASGMVLDRYLSFAEAMDSQLPRKPLHWSRQGFPAEAQISKQALAWGICGLVWMSGLDVYDVYVQENSLCTYQACFGPFR